jgi:hypothetical protein
MNCPRYCRCDCNPTPGSFVDRLSSLPKTYMVGMNTAKVSSQRIIPAGGLLFCTQGTVQSWLHGSCIHLAEYPRGGLPC